MPIDVRCLDLSDSLLPSWEVVALITVELPKLETLSLKCEPLPCCSALPYAKNRSSQVGTASRH